MKPVSLIYNLSDGRYWNSSIEPYLKQTTLSVLAHGK